MAKYREVREKSAAYHHIDIDTSRGPELVSLSGYFQSMKHFQNSQLTVSRLLDVPQRLQERVRQSIPAIDNTDSVVVHVRRGDYETLSHIYALLEKSYYLDSLRTLPDVKRVIIVSDDKQWCKSELAPYIDADVIFSPFEDEVMEFVVLYMAKRIVIANSTYSFWAALLKHMKGNHSTHVVVAPSIRYAKLGRAAHLNEEALYLDDWTIVEI